VTRPGSTRRAALGSRLPSDDGDAPFRRPAHGPRSRVRFREARSQTSDVRVARPCQGRDWLGTRWGKRRGTAPGDVASRSRTSCGAPGTRVENRGLGRVLPIPASIRMVDAFGTNKPHAATSRDSGDPPRSTRLSGPRLAVYSRPVITRVPCGPHQALDREAASAKPEVRRQRSATLSGFRVAELRHDVQRGDLSRSAYSFNSLRSQCALRGSFADGKRRGDRTRRRTRDNRRMNRCLEKKHVESQPRPLELLSFSKSCRCLSRFEISLWRG
jgi:hypothetical protein